MGKDKIMEHNKRVEQIKTYLERLSAGEELEKVMDDAEKIKIFVGKSLFTRI